MCLKIYDTRVSLPPIGKYVTGYRIFDDDEGKVRSYERTFMRTSETEWEAEQTYYDETDMVEANPPDAWSYFVTTDDIRNVLKEND